MLNFNFNRHQLIAAYTIVALALVGAIVMVVRSGSFASSSDEIKLDGVSITDPAPSQPETSSQPAKLCVHVAGKVKAPGVYELDAGKRVVDAIKIAGGPSPKADLESVNLAEKLVDGEQVYIAMKGELPPITQSMVRGGPSSPGRVIAGGAASRRSESHEDSGPEKLMAPGQGTVNINTAGLAELQRLNKVGPATAQRILDYRAQNGRFKSIEELDEVKGIGPATIEKLRPFIAL